jgi:hypothetical protein
VRAQFADFVLAVESQLDAGIAQIILSVAVVWVIVMMRSFLVSQS